MSYFLKYFGIAKYALQKAFNSLKFYLFFKLGELHNAEKNHEKLSDAIDAANRADSRYSSDSEYAKRVRDTFTRH